MKLGLLPYLVDGRRKNGKDRGKSFLTRWHLLANRVGQQQYHLNRPRQHKIAKFPKFVTESR